MRCQSKVLEFSVYFFKLWNFYYYYEMRGCEYFFLFYIIENGSFQWRNFTILKNLLHRYILYVFYLHLYICVFYIMFWVKRLYCTENCADNHCVKESKICRHFHAERYWKLRRHSVLNVYNNRHDAHIVLSIPSKRWRLTHLQFLVRNRLSPKDFL